MLENKTSNNWKVISVNYLKALAIFLVIAGHTNTSYSNFIYSFHMPLFFFVSGFFLRSKTFIQELKNGYNKLLLPYIFFSLLSIFIYILKSLLLNREITDIKAIIKGILFGMDSDYILTYGFVLWFLLALFIARTIINVLISRISLNNVLIILFLMGYLVKDYNLPLCISQGVLGAYWLAFGKLYYTKINRIIKNRIIYLLLFLLTFLVIFYKIPTVDISNLIIENYIYFIFYNSILLLFIAETTEIIVGCYKSNLLYKIGENTMFIFILHPYTNNIGYLLSDGKAPITITISIFLLIISYIVFEQIKSIIVKTHDFKKNK